MLVVNVSFNVLVAKDILHVISVLLHLLILVLWSQMGLCWWIYHVHLDKFCIFRMLFINKSRSQWLAVLYHLCLYFLSVILSVWREGFLNLSLWLWNCWCLFLVLTVYVSSIFKLFCFRYVLICECYKFLVNWSFLSFWSVPLYP